MCCQKLSWLKVYNHFTCIYSQKKLPAIRLTLCRRPDRIGGCASNPHVMRLGKSFADGTRANKVESFKCVGLDGGAYLVN